MCVYIYIYIYTHTYTQLYVYSAAALGFRVRGREGDLKTPPGLACERAMDAFGQRRAAPHELHEEFTRLAETRLAQNTLDYLNIA